jgi:hypothetical protein
MIREISYGVEFLRKLLEPKLPKDSLNAFCAALSVVLHQKYLGHWRPGQPNHGNAFRSIFTTLDKVDPVIREACVQCAIAIETVAAALPGNITIWIDPEEVRAPSARPCFRIALAC